MLSNLASQFACDTSTSVVAIVTPLILKLDPVLILISPSTSSLYTGAVLAIPTLPLVTFRPPVIPVFNNVVTSLSVYDVNAAPPCVKLPLKLISPVTSKLYCGLLLKIPTLPVGSIVNNLVVVLNI